MPNVSVWARTVVIADAVFTASAVVVQLASGLALAVLAGFSLRESWLSTALALYAGSMAGFQLPAGALAGRFGGPVLLALGTAHVIRQVTPGPASRTNSTASDPTAFGAMV